MLSAVKRSTATDTAMPALPTSIAKPQLMPPTMHQFKRDLFAKYSTPVKAVIIVILTLPAVLLLLLILKSVRRTIRTGRELLRLQATLSANHPIEEPSNEQAQVVLPPVAPRPPSLSGVPESSFRPSSPSIVTATPSTNPPPYEPPAPPYLAMAPLPEDSRTTSSGTAGAAVVAPRMP